MTKKGIKQMAYRHPVGAMRLVCGAFFLALLGVCGYIGAERTHVQSVVSLPVTRVELEGEAVGGSSITQIRGRLNRQREEELTLLDRVIADAGADSAAKEDALSRRMETEAQMTAVLEGMGAENALAVCGAQGVTLLIPQEMGMDETARNRLLNAVGGQSGIEMTQLKIILIKK